MITFAVAFEVEFVSVASCRFVTVAFVEFVAVELIVDVEFAVMVAVDVELPLGLEEVEFTVDSVGAATVVFFGGTVTIVVFVVGTTEEEVLFAVVCELGFETVVELDARTGSGLFVTLITVVLPLSAVSALDVAFFANPSNTSPPQSGKYWSTIESYWL